jgi:hypothetical protein
MGIGYEGSEKREFKRVRANFLVVYHVRDPHRTSIASRDKDTGAVMYDISEAGLAILTNHDISSCTTLALRFTLVNPAVSEKNRVRTIETLGEVRYSTLLEDKEDKQAIGNLVQTFSGQ